MIIRIYASNTTAGSFTKSYTPPAGYRWKILFALLSVTGTSTANSSLSIGIEGLNAASLLTLIDSASSSTSTTAYAYYAPTSNATAYQTSDLWVNYPQYLYLNGTNNGTLTYEIMIEEVPG